MPRPKDTKPGSEVYKREWEWQKKTGENKKNTVRQRARRMFDKLGIDRDGKDIDHKKAIESGGTSARSNLRLRDKSENRSDNGHKKGEKKGK